MKKIHNKKSLKEIRKKLRNKMTESEILLWKELKGKKIAGLKFRRQHSIDNYIVDFYCSELKLVIELDRSQHYYKEGKEKDCERDKNLQIRGIEILRIANDEIRNNLDGVVQGLWNRTR